MSLAGSAHAAQCRICDGPTTPAFSTTDRNRRLSPERFRYVRCGRCGTLALENVPEDLSAYYPADYYHLPRSRADLLAEGADLERAKLSLIQHFVPAGRLVEVGPAVGRFLAVSQDAGYDVEAIEMDEECCRFLEHELDVPTTRSDAPAAALASGERFDVIVLWQVLEHLRDPTAVLGAGAQALSPGGILALAAPNPNALQADVFGSRWTHVDAPRHLFLLPMHTVIGIAQSHGLGVVLKTTSDPSALAWNHFGWRESLAGMAPGRRSGHALRFVGSAIARAAAPIERRDERGATYTLLFRRPGL